MLDKVKCVCTINKENLMKYKKITFIIFIFAMLFNNNVYAEKKYFANRREIRDGLNNITGYIYSEPITAELARLNRLIIKKPVYELETELADNILVPVNTTTINTASINPTPSQFNHGTASSIRNPTAVDPDPLTTPVPSAEISLVSNNLQILSELNKVDLTSLTEEYSPEQIENITNSMDNFYTTTLGDVTSPEKAVEISHTATKNHIDLKKYYNPNNLDSSDDTYVNTLLPKQQSEVYLATIYDIENRDEKAEGYPELVAKKEPLDRSVNRLEVYDELVQIATDTTNSRIMELVAADISTPAMAVSGALPEEKNYYTGISAGNTRNNLNSVWVRGTYGGVRQGKNLKNSSFYGNTYGGTIGADGNITDDILLGISYTRLYADFKYRIGLGNKARTISDIMSVYGITKLNDRYTLQGLFTTGKTLVKQKAKRLININTYKTAFGEFDVNTYCAETILNYKVPSNTYTIIPSLGFRYSRNYDSGYNEYGTGVHNFHVSGRTYTSFSALLGLKLKRSYNISDNLILTPGIHGQIERHLYNKADGVQIHKQWVNNFSDGTKVPQTSIHKTGYNLGSTVSLAYKDINFLLTYNTHMRKKYQSHQGTLRVKYSL